MDRCFGLPAWHTARAHKATADRATGDMATGCTIFIFPSKTLSHVIDAHTHFWPLHRLADTPPETPEIKNEAPAAVAPPAPTAAPPLPPRPDGDTATSNAVGETTGSTPSPALEGEKEAEVAGEATTSSPPHPDTLQETAASPEPLPGEEVIQIEVHTL